MWFIFVGNCEKNEPVLIESLFFPYGMEKNNTMLYNYMFFCLLDMGWFSYGKVFIWDGTPSQNHISPRCQPHCVAGRHMRIWVELQPTWGGGTQWKMIHMKPTYIGALLTLKKSRWWFQIFFYVQPYLGKISNLTNMFQRGWNHQLEIDLPVSPVLNMFTKEATRRHVHPQEFSYVFFN